MVDARPNNLTGDNNQNEQKKTSNFDGKNYLNVKLENGADSKKLIIRLLPINVETGDVFAKVHTHNVSVPTEVSQNGFKSYICLSRNKDIDHETYGSKCPFCEINKQKYDESLNETDPDKKKALQMISIDNRPKESVILRCIERGKENEGPKFWKFNIRSDKTDPYNQIINLYEERKKAGELKGKDVNILSLYKGKDLIVTITEGNAAPTIIDDDEYSPLSENEELMNKWVNDSKRWQDVFTVKPYEYLKIVSEGKVPWFDKDNNVWISREPGTIYKRDDNSKKDDAAAAENAVANAEAEKTTVQSSKTETAPVRQNVETYSDDLPF